MIKCEWEFINEIVNNISQNELMKHTKEISQWERLSGSNAELEAFNYINSYLNSIGEETQIYFADALISIPIEGKISFKGINLKADPPSMSGITPKDGICAIAKYVDANNITVPGKINLDGNIAVIDGMPMPNLLEALKSINCMGVVFIQSAQYVSESIMSPVWGSPSIENRNLMPSLPVVSINKSDGEKLKNFLIENPEEYIELHTNLVTRWLKIPILICEIKSQCNNDDFVLFSGHVDSWYYGAMDNGTANATMLEVARVMSMKKNIMKRNLRLAFWSGHSHGRYAGSAWYADEFWQDIHDNCIVHINIDSVGAKNASVLTEAHVMAETKAIASEYIKKYAGQDLDGIRVGRAGDQSFWGHGVPSLFLTLSEQPPHGNKKTEFAKLIGGSGKTSGLGWWWHTSEDTYDKIDPENLLRDAKIYAASVVRFCCDIIIPIDLKPAMEEIINQLKYWQEEAGDKFNISNLINKAEVLKEKIFNFYEIVNFEESANENKVNIMTVNKLIKDLDRVIVPINYVQCDIFHQDAAINKPAVPSLSLLKGLNNECDENIINEVIVEAKRIRNKIYYMINEGIKLIDDAVKNMK